MTHKKQRLELTWIGKEERPRKDHEMLSLVVASPSGAGKTTLTRRLLAKFPELTFSVSHTTRRPRARETDGQDYHFVDQDTFLKMVDAQRFAEWALVHGNYYGTSLAEVDRARTEGKAGLVFDVDYQGARQIKAMLPATVGIFILPPSLRELERRLRTRASDDDASITRRLQKAQHEIEHYPFFDYLIVNEHLESATEQLCGVVHAERCRRAQLASRAEALLGQNAHGLGLW